MTPLEQKLTLENERLTKQLAAVTAALAAVTARLEVLLQIVRERTGKKRKEKEPKPKEPPKGAADLTDEQREAFENRPQPGAKAEEPKAEPTVQTRPGRRLSTLKRSTTCRSRRAV